MKHRFRSVIEQARGPGATVLLIPADVATALGGLKQQRVIGSVNGGEPFTTSTYPWKGVGLYVGVPKASRDAVGVGLGDEVELEVDTRPRAIALPPELETAFAAEPELRTRFEALSWSRKQLIAEPVAAAKKPETRAARLVKALAELREER